MPFIKEMNFRLGDREALYPELTVMVDTARSRNFVTSFASMLVLELKHTQSVGIELLLQTRNCVKSTRDFRGM